MSRFFLYCIKKIMEKKSTKEAAENQVPTCGLVMPISAIDGMSSEHWSDVRSILEQVATDAGFVTKLVSSATVSGLLPARIVTNLYQNDIVICDVSGRNPNVMFELGLRLAFDKPTIIIKDDVTEYTFDIQSIGHLDYPRSLRITKMELFKAELTKSLLETHKRKIEDPSYSTFLKHYQIFEAKGLETNSDLQTFVANGFEMLSKEISYLRENQARSLTPFLSATTNRMLEGQHMNKNNYQDAANYFDVVVKKTLEINKDLPFPLPNDDLIPEIQKQLQDLYGFSVADEIVRKHLKRKDV
jgi:hypothetical protein